MIRPAADDGYERVGVPRKLHKGYLTSAMCRTGDFTSVLLSQGLAGWRN